MSHKQAVHTQMPSMKIPHGYKPATMPSMPTAKAPKTTTFDKKAGKR